MLKYAINLFYLGSADRADKKLKALMKQKRKILEDVMNTETYNRAQQILKRFDPLGLVIREEGPTPSRPFFKREIETNTRMRPVSANLNFQNGPSQMQEPRELTTQTPQILGPLSTIEATTTQPSKGPITHRPILPRKRSIFDVVVDALVGDGPDRRYALICHQCAGHNGMALAEEFEYLAFRCCYCGFHNPARRIRRNPPPVPRLQTFPSPGSRSSIGTPLSGCSRGFSASAANLSVTGPTPPSPINKSSSTENVFLGTPVLSKVVEVSGLFSVESEESENLSLPSGSPTGVHASKQQTKRTRKLH
ncbi:unnamed protein product [Mesocestoides corti]|nr:unnamed protein product [Mesocestoides corti]